MSLVVMLMLLFAAETGLSELSYTVRVGIEVAVPCANVIKTQQNCEQTSWLYSRDGGDAAEELVAHGRVRKTKIANAASKRLNEDCSLVITNVTRGDAGRYVCRQFRPRERVPDALVYLSVIFMESHGAHIFYCSVIRYDRCWHAVQWLYRGSLEDIKTLQSVCSARVTLRNHHLVQRSNLDALLFCNVTDNRSGQTLLCNVSHTSCVKTGSPSSERELTEELTKIYKGRLRFIVVSVGLAALITTVVSVNIWAKIKGAK